MAQSVGNECDDINIAAVGQKPDPNMKQIITTAEQDPVYQAIKSVLLQDRILANRPSDPLVDWTKDILGLSLL